jgi:hypothetical protein
MIDYAPSRSHSRAATRLDDHEYSDDREPARIRYDAYDEQSEGRSNLRPSESHRSRSSHNRLER